MKKVTGRIGVLWSLLLAVLLSSACVYVTSDSQDIISYLTEEMTRQTLGEETATKQEEAATEKETAPKPEEAATEKETAPKQEQAVTEKETAPKPEEAATENETVLQTQAFEWHEFASKNLYDQHYEKHVITQQEYGDISQEEYLRQANELFNATGDHILTKKEEDGDTLYYNTETNDFGVLRPDGVIRTFFKPSAGIDYFNRQ